MSAIPGDERGVVVDWLIKVVVGLALAGVVVFDALAITVNYVALDSTANDIAIEVSSDVGASGPGSLDPGTIAAARRLAREAGARLVDVDLDEQGVLTVELARVANTIVVDRLDATRRWARAVAAGRSGTR